MLFPPWLVGSALGGLKKKIDLISLIKNPNPPWIDLQVYSPAASPKSAISGQRLGHFEALKSAKMRTDIQGSFRGPVKIVKLVNVLKEQPIPREKLDLKGIGSCLSE